MEPRARATRHKSSLNFGNELNSLLFAAGAPTHPDLLRPQPDDSSTTYLTTLPTLNKDHPPTPFSQPFPETVRVLDEILTDFIIETCHNAVAVASYSGRTKLKLSDFEWVVRNDGMKLGRVHEMFRKERAIKDSKKLFGNKGEQGKLAVNDLIDLGNAAGEEGTGKGKGRGRGRRKKKRGLEEVDGSGAGAGAGLVNGAAAGDARKDGSSVVDADLDEADIDDDDIFGDADDRPTKKAKSEIG